MADLVRGTAFSFRYHRVWQVWKRGFGAAQVLAVDRDTVHLRVFGDGAVIAHMPIQRESVDPFVQRVLPSPRIPDGLDELGQSAIAAWRHESSDGKAGVFSVALGEAVDLIMRTIHPAETSTVVIESAYPVFMNGTWRTVRVILAGG
jgi:hypothetical protein